MILGGYDESSNAYESHIYEWYYSYACVLVRKIYLNTCCKKTLYSTISLCILLKVNQMILRKNGNGKYIIGCK